MSGTAVSFAASRVSLGLLERTLSSARAGAEGGRRCFDRSSGGPVGWMAVPGRRRRLAQRGGGSLDFILTVAFFLDAYSRTDS
jgi:hypothetical protein